MIVANLPLASLDPHPRNPRVFMDQARIDRLAELIRRDGFADCHALLVRPLGGRYQVVSGHHRRLAALAVGLTEVPCWVVEMSDEDAHDQLRMQNDHGELDGLEEGRHIFGAVDMADIGNGRGNTGGLREYCRRLGLVRQTEEGKLRAWMVADKMAARAAILPNKAKALELIARKAPDEDWGALATEVMANDLSYRDVERLLSTRYPAPTHAAAPEPSVEREPAPVESAPTAQASVQVPARPAFTPTPEPAGKRQGIDINGMLDACAQLRGVTRHELLTEIVRDWVASNFPEVIGHE